MSDERVDHELMASLLEEEFNKLEKQFGSDAVRQYCQEKYGKQDKSKNADVAQDIQPASGPQVSAPPEPDAKKSELPNNSEQLDMNNMKARDLLIQGRDEDDSGDYVKLRNNSERELSDDIGYIKQQLTGLADLLEKPVPETIRALFDEQALVTLESIQGNIKERVTDAVRQGLLEADKKYRSEFNNCIQFAQDKGWADDAERVFAQTRRIPGTIYPSFVNKVLEQLQIRLSDVYRGTCLKDSGRSHAWRIYFDYLRCQLAEAGFLTYEPKVGDHIIESSFFDNLSNDEYEALHFQRPETPKFVKPSDPEHPTGTIAEIVSPGIVALKPDGTKQASVNAVVEIYSDNAKSE